MVSTVILNKDGRITIPKEYRNYFRQGDKVKIYSDNGIIKMILPSDRC